MYHFSRCIYRELAPRVAPADDVEARCAARHEVLDACEATIRRMAYDRRHFARPAPKLFAEIRDHFPLAEQVRVYMVVEHYVNLVEDFLESLPDDFVLDGRPRNCLASTRRGTACRREPLPGRDYCPSHKHLEETFAGSEVVAA
ncbi:MAG: hypothetical protein ACRDKH_00100 [Solirubrobacterales bacterium]